jgi:hypothetical protein
VRDAAYAMLTDADRALGHLLAAQFLEEAGERDALVLAEHWERSGELSRAAGWYRRAAWQALEGNDLDAVLRHADRASACGLSGPELGDVRAVRAEAHLWRGDYNEVIRHGRTARELLVPRSPRWFQVSAALAVAAGRLTDNATIKEVARALLSIGAEGETSDAFVITSVRTALQLYIAGDFQLARALFDAAAAPLQGGAPRPPAVEAMLLLLRANRASAESKFDVALRYYEQSAALFEEIGDLRNAGSQKLDAAFYHLDLGNFTRAEKLARELIATASRLGLGRLLSVATGALASSLFWQGRYDEVLAIGPQLAGQAAASGDRRILGSVHIINARIGLVSGDLESAEASAEKAIAEFVEMARFRARALALHARIVLARGRPADALRSAEQGYAILETLGRLGTDEALVELAYAQAVAQAGRGQEASEVLRRGRDRLLAQAGCIADLELRRGFLSLPEHAELLAACDRPFDAGEAAAAANAIKRDLTPES